MGDKYGVCVNHEEHPYINEEPLIFIPNDRSYFKILDYEIRGHGDLEEFLNDLEECKDAQHRWNELKVFLMKYRREKTRFGYRQTLLCSYVDH